MDLIQVRKIAKDYEDLLINYYKAEPVRYTLDPANPDAYLATDPIETMNHCAWTCQQILKKEIDIEDAMRWLGFVQGAFWTLGIRSISQMRKDNSQPQVEVKSD